MPLFHRPLKNHQESALSTRADPEGNDNTDPSPPPRLTKSSSNPCESGISIQCLSKEKLLAKLRHQDTTSLLLVIYELSRQLQRLESDQSQLQNENRRLKDHLHGDRSDRKKKQFLDSNSHSLGGTKSQQYHDRWTASVDRGGDRGGLVFPQRRPELVSNEENYSKSKWSGNVQRKKFQKRSQSCKSLDGQCVGGPELGLMVPPKRSRSCSIMRTVIPEEPDLEEAETNEAKGESAATVPTLESSQDNHILSPLVVPLQAEAKSCTSPLRCPGSGVGTILYTCSGVRTILEKDQHIDMVARDQEESFIFSPYSDSSSSSSFHEESSTAMYDHFRNSLSALTLCLDEIRLVEPRSLSSSPQFSS